ncbi:toxin-antitoxin system YwqK family antitoxin [Portibacter lacus]|uniref:MORN repeat variant n=1 Tax=Portibacter lacus TaxID=1099794 RepID=A0AA37SSH8_9BACT|nr:hypothetical protein [Portibacter lacus]GLR19598.1 hypothetical protein GCM10007940_42140 [Portibacter lacus]
MKKGFSKLKGLILFACLTLAATFIFDFYLIFDEEGNKLSMLQFKIVPIDYVYAYRYNEGKVISRGIRHKKRIHFTFYDSLGRIEAEEKGLHDQFPIIRTSYHSNGKLMSYMQKKGSVRHGEQKIYDYDGQLVKTRLYKNGHLLREINTVNKKSEIYPYIETTRLTDEKAIEFKFDFTHIVIQEANSAIFHYDFSVDSSEYYTTRYSEIIDSSILSVKFEADSSMLEFNQIYGYIQLDSIKHPAFAKDIEELINLANSSK